MNKKCPPWLKAMQNGTIAEARTKAFLLDRFWILERSVDIYGADFLIQRKIDNKNILDREISKLGIVQVKFFGHKKTVHHIHKEYVVDDDNSPRPDFFLHFHCGNEDEARSFLLTSSDIQNNFTVSNNLGIEKYKISYRSIVENGKFEITNKNRALDRIENQLAYADFFKNRRFLSWALPSVDVDIDAILPIYQEPLENWWGDIPLGFKKIKKAAYSAIQDIEEVYEIIREISEETDPIAVEKLVDKLSRLCAYNHGVFNVRLPDDLNYSDLFDVCREHKEKVDQLKNDGILDSFLDLKYILREHFIDFLAPKFPFNKDMVHFFTMYYDQNSLAIKQIDSTLISALDFFDIPKEYDEYGNLRIGAHEISSVYEIYQGIFKYYWMPGRYYFSGYRSMSFREFLSAEVYVYYDCQEQIYKAKYED